MPVNIFSAGRDALLDEMARRDAKRVQDQQLARQTRLDEESRVSRDRQIDLQERQVVGQERDREMRATAGLAAQGAEQEKNQRVQQWIRELVDPATPQPKKDAIGLMLDQMDVSPTLIERFVAPQAPKTRPVYRTNPDGTVTHVGTVPEGTHFTQTDRPASGAGSDLPPQVKEYLSGLPTMTRPDGQPYSLRDAIDQVNRNSAAMRARGEQVPDMAKVISFVRGLYVPQTDEFGRTSYPGTAAGPMPTAAPSVSAPGGVPGVDAAVRAFEARSGGAGPSASGAETPAGWVPIPGHPGAFAAQREDGQWVRVR